MHWATQLVRAILVTLMLVESASVASERKGFTAEQACASLKKVISRRDGVPESGPPGLGWFCETSLSTDQKLYVIALRSNRPAPYSNLMGWYAVDRDSGKLHVWDLETQRATPLGETAQGKH